MKLVDKKAIVTGAASGIGRTAAIRMAGEGAAVLAVDVCETGLAETAAMAKEKGLALEVFRCDVSKENEVQSAVACAMGLFGRIDVLVNIAGISTTKYVTETSWADYTRLMDVNMGGCFLFTREVLKHMKVRRSGAIVNLASELAFVGYPDLAAYTASKGAMVAFSRSVALDAIRYGVRVNCVCPGATDTPIYWDGVTDAAERQKMLEQVKVEKPIGRLITTDEVAGGIIFMASEDASACVGAELVMDGGFIAI